ncbi:AAA family ATPase [Marinobacter koreensis]|uniref:AAA family ATPase n=1 Tax=Marinobacter koreensis TaxID=335974 RepID=A0ABW0RKM4_9GAMM|nr:ATP-binding protein [Marinobacter koreensis]MCK7546480.1 ATP-binding protein [Marinobacter koreensis]
MANSSQLKALLRSHADEDDDRFYAVMLQVAANEARKGHQKLASEIKSLVEKLQIESRSDKLDNSSPTPLTQTPDDLGLLLEKSNQVTHLSELTLPEGSRSHVFRILLEQRQRDKLRSYGLIPKRKLLFCGPPGTGKTMTASVLATELKLPLYTVLLDGLITRYLGETATKLRRIFEFIASTRAIFLFDEFDAIGSKRDSDNDIGEVRRILNSFLQFLEKDRSESIVIAATNYPSLLDKALFRRFDDLIEFELPSKDQIKLLISNRLSRFSIDRINLNSTVEFAEGLSPSEIVQACDDAAKTAILEADGELKSDFILEALQKRNAK